MIQDKDNIHLTNWEIVSVNPNDKKWDWKDLFCFWGVNIQSIIAFSLITSLYLVYELNTLIVFLGTLLGTFFVYIFSNLIGKPSQKYGIPFAVFLRTSIGIKGAKYISLLRGLVGIFSFGIQTFFLSISFGYLIRIFLFTIDETIMDQEIFITYLMGLGVIDWISFIFAILLQAFLFSRNHFFNKLFINFSVTIVYIGMIIFLIIIFSEHSKDVSKSFKDIITYDLSTIKHDFIPLLTVAGYIFAYFSIVIMNFGDFSRYVKNNKELTKGNLSLILNLFIFSIFSLFIVIGADIILNKNLNNMEKILTNPRDIIGKFDNNYLTVVVLFFILFASISTNLIANYIPAQNTLLNYLPNKLSLKSTAIIISFIGFLIGIFWVPLLSQIGILSFVDTVSSFFGPLFGIMIVDYYLIKNKEIINKDIFSSSKSGTYFYSNGWHIKATYSLIIGFIFSASTIWNVNLMFLHSFSWIIGATVSSITYYLLANR